MNFIVSEKKIAIEGHEATEFPHPITKTLTFKDHLVVLLEIKPKIEFNENVFGLNKEGKIIWQIPKTRRIGNDSPYTGMSKKEETLVLHNWDGYSLTVDSLTGKIMNEEFTK